MFRVSGTIPLESQVKIENPLHHDRRANRARRRHLHSQSWSASSNTHDVIIRYMRFRPGDRRASSTTASAAKGEPGDHRSLLGELGHRRNVFDQQGGESLPFNGAWSTESLYNSIHKRGKHGYGGLWGGPGGSWHHNILAHHSSRNPRASGNEESGLDGLSQQRRFTTGASTARMAASCGRETGSTITTNPGRRRIAKCGIAFSCKPTRAAACMRTATIVWGFPEISQEQLGRRHRFHSKTATPPNQRCESMSRTSSRRCELRRPKRLSSSC